jgi:hypothetical protein
MITYKNITEVEVLEQASENTKVLVNEGGELMQAPYSNFEDKMSNAEMLEEIPENAKVLVNDGGKLKQVACKEKGSTFIVRFSMNPDGTGTCDKTFAEIYEAAKTMNVSGILESEDGFMHIKLMVALKDFGATFVEELVGI